MINNPESFGLNNLETKGEVLKFGFGKKPVFLVHL